MANVYTTGPYEYEGGGIFKRVSWGALFAGLVVTLVIELVLSLLGLGIGLGSVKPATEQHPFSGVGIGAAIWLGVTTLIALFIGGWVTAKLAGSVRGLNGVLHSIVMWGLVSLLSFYLMTTAFGALIGGAASIIGKGLSAVTSGVVMGQGKGAGAGGGAAAPADQDLKAALQRMLSSGQISPADRETLINTLSTRANMSRADAEKKVDSWIQEYQQAAQSPQQTKEQALQTAQQAMQGLSKASIWIFVLMVLEAAAAAWGGWLGSSRELEPPTV